MLSILPKFSRVVKRFHEAIHTFHPVYIPNEARAIACCRASVSATGCSRPEMSVPDARIATPQPSPTRGLVPPPEERCGDPGVPYAGDERPGSYDVWVSAEGYRLWITEGVEVTRMRCGIEPVMLDARLEPIR